MVDLARETGPTLAYTTPGPPGTSGHTILAPQGNSAHLVALNTIYHEIAHTMVDDALIAAIAAEAGRQGVKAPKDLWHAVMLYTTTDITKSILPVQDAAALDGNLVAMFDRNGWKQILRAIESDWQPYLDGRATYEGALSNLVRDTSEASK